MIKFVILATQRSGSTLLVRSLDLHENILLSGEIFYVGSGIHHPENQFRYFKVPLVNNRYQFILNVPRLAFSYKSHLRNYFDKLEKTGVSAVGFKLMVSQMKYMPGFISFCRKEDIKPIVLIRKNSADVVFSSFVAKSTGHYHSNEKQKQSPESTKLFFEPKLFLQQIKIVEGVNSMLKKISENTSGLTIYYEDFAEWDQLIAEICKFLVIDFQAIPQALKKLNKGNTYEKLITNYSSLISLLPQQGQDENSERSADRL